MKSCLMVAGGPLDLTFAAGFLKGRHYDFVLAVDAGLSACSKLKLNPDLAVGDFDTFGRERILRLSRESGLALEIHRPEKDESDTELAFRVLADSGCTRADILGATGGRLDHELANIHLLYQAKRRGLSANCYDAQNRIRLIDAATEPRTVFRRDTVYGKYVSFLPFTERVLGITLDGFRYPLNKKDISVFENPSLCVSNELAEDEAVLTFDRGILICVESLDKERDDRDR